MIFILTLFHLCVTWIVEGPEWVLGDVRRLYHSPERSDSVLDYGDFTGNRIK